MITQIKTTVSQSRATLIQDAMGMLALVVMLVVALYLPGLS